MSLLSNYFPRICARTLFLFTIIRIHYCFTLYFFLEKTGLANDKDLGNWRDVADTQGNPVFIVSGVDI